jgi:hypothetical protein
MARKQRVVSDCCKCEYSTPTKLTRKDGKVTEVFILSEDCYGCRRRYPDLYTERKV